jgi:hypothetical protein
MIRMRGVVVGMPLMHYGSTADREARQAVLEGKEVGALKDKSEAV